MDAARTRHAPDVTGTHTGQDVGRDRVAPGTRIDLFLAIYREGHERDTERTCAYESTRAFTRTRTRLRVATRAVSPAAFGGGGMSSREPVSSARSLDSWSSASVVV